MAFLCQPLRAFRCVWVWRFSLDVPLPSNLLRQDRGPNHESGTPGGSCDPGSGALSFSITQEASVPSNVFGLFAGIAIGLLAAWVYFLLWRARYTARIRADAVQRSQAVTAGKVHEQLIPYLPAFPYNPKDVRFLGSPIDLVVFDGLAEGDLRGIVFLEVKTGGSSLTSRERRVRDVILAREVEWVELRVAGPLAGAEKD
jgi:Endonuclease related to archaeal Holliday junction resolvase